jgi:hypothetical protein
MIIHGTSTPTAMNHGSPAACASPVTSVAASLPKAEAQREVVTM